MMKSLGILQLLCWMLWSLSESRVTGQGNWTWLSGSNTINQVGVYGTQGIAAVNNRPGVRQQHSMVIHPTGQLISVFGGYGYDTVGAWGLLNDMWMFNVTSGWWTWLKGINTIDQRGVYGIQGVASVNNRPGGRRAHSIVIHPTGQLIFVFGGYGYDATIDGYLNDMWMFNVTSGWWTWLSGNSTINQAGVYGTQGVASLNNRPGARWIHSIVIHSSGQLIFVFGGYGYDTAGAWGRLNDLWMFNVTSCWWTWLSGSNSRNQAGVYGTQGVASLNNRPGARSGHSMVIHPTGQLIVVFGGLGYDTANTGYLNDMWMFNVTDGRWTWVSGSNSRNQLGVYGTQGVASVNIRPGARVYHSIVMQPSGQFIFLFGGEGYDTSTTLGYLNDMWMFNVTSGWWTWVSGSNTRNQVGVYGTQGVTSLNNRPGARYSHSMVMHPADQSIFVFGGFAYDAVTTGWLNDMWIYSSPLVSLSLPEYQSSVINLTPSVSILSHSSITLTNINLPPSVSSLSESQLSVTNLTAPVSILYHNSSSSITQTLTNIILPSTASSLPESQSFVTSLTATVTILIDSSSPLISTTMTNINFPSSTMQVNPPSQKPITTVRLKWWLTIGPVYGFLIIFFATWTLFMIGVLAGFVYDERQNRAANRKDTESSSTPADSSSFTDSSFPSSSTKPTSSYGLSKSSNFETTSSYPPTLVASTNQGTPSHSTNNATSSHRYHPNTTTNTTGLGDPPTLVAPSTKGNSSYAQ